MDDQVSLRIGLTPEDPADALRWQHSRARRAVLYGEHMQLVADRAEERLGFTKASEYGRPDLTCNILEQASDALAALYHETPGTSNSENNDAARPLLRAIEDCGYWALMQRIQRDTLGMREHFVLQDLREGKPYVRRVFVDTLVAESPEASPEQPDFVRFVIWDVNPKTNEEEYLWAEYDVRDVERPVHRLLNAKLEPVRIVDGAAYIERWSDADDVPYIPGTMYHAATTGELFDPYTWRELYEGTIECSVHWTMWAHGVREASWPQKYMYDSKAAGKDDKGRVYADRNTILPLKTDPAAPPGVTGKAGQFAPGCDPDKLFSALAAYERRIASLAGLNPADVHRVSGDPRSGYGLAIKRDGLRAAQARYREVFLRSDLHAIGVWAKLWNKQQSDQVPVDGYNVRYEAIKLSPAEVDAELKRIAQLREFGLTSPEEDLMRLNPGMTLEEAERRLQTYNV